MKKQVRIKWNKLHAKPQHLKNKQIKIVLYHLGLELWFREAWLISEPEPKGTAALLNNIITCTGT